MFCRSANVGHKAATAATSGAVAVEQGAENLESNAGGAESNAVSVELNATEMVLSVILGVAFRQADMTGMDGDTRKEYGSRGTEGVGRFCREVAGGCATSEQGIHFRMAAQVVGKAVGHIIALTYKADMLRSIAANLVVEQGVVGTTEDDGVYLLVLGQQGFDALTDKVVGSI